MSLWFMHIEPSSWFMNFIIKNHFVLIFCMMIVLCDDVVIWQAYFLNTGVFIVSCNFKDLPYKKPNKIFRVSTDSILDIY